MALGNESERTLQEAFSVVQLPCSILLPVLAILCVTSEWSQRTALTTFALVTKRSRVVIAKVLAAVAISAIAVWGILTAIIPGMDDVAKWLDLGPSTTDLSEFDISGVGWAHLATSVALWVAIPFVIGLVRIIRREVS